jgi:hypothetical protein
MERMQNPECGEGKKDFLDGFLEAKKENPDLVTDNEVIGWMIINVSSNPCPHVQLTQPPRSSAAPTPSPS